MKNPRIYQNIALNIGADIELDKTASHYLSRVLRLKNKSTIRIFNGDGFEYSAIITFYGKSIHLHITGSTHTDNESNLNITLLQGISKGDRMDTCIQKAVELGVNQITPVICERTVVNLKADRSDKKLRHWQGIIISACEQSGRNILPRLDEPVHFDEIIQQPLDGLSLTLDPCADNNFNSFELDSNQVNLLTGPEGGLTNNEIHTSLQNNFAGVRMGKRILRTETAAIAAISALQTLWGDFTN